MTKTRDLANLGSGFLQIGGSDRRSVEAKLQETVSVKDFGAKGDGEWDDTAAIQAAINAVNTGTVLFPPGTYKTTAKLYTSYGKNIRLQGSLVYGDTKIRAHHADHVFQYGFTVYIDGIGFFRDSAYVAEAKTNQKNGIHSDDTGGAINGAAYTKITNCVSNNHYIGIRMHGTHQTAENNVCNDSEIGMALYGSVHTIAHNATENNNLTSLIITGNGSRVLSHYSDGNCAGASGLNYGAITLSGDMNNIAGVQFNDNNGAPHFFLDTARHNTIGNCNFYTTTPRVTLYSTGGDNTFNNRIECYRYGVVTVSGNAYHNFFPEGWTFSGGMQDTYNPTGTELQQFMVCGSFGSGEIGAGQYKILNGTLNAAHDHTRTRLHIPENHGSANINIEIVGARLYIYGNGSTRTEDVQLVCRATTTGVGLETFELAAFSGTQQYGAEVNSTYNQFNPRKLGASNRQFSFGIINNGASALLGASAIVYYRLKTSQSYV